MAAKKASAKKSTAKKSAVKKSTAKKSATKKSAVKKVSAEKAPAKKSAAKKSAVKKVSAKKAPAKKAAAKKSVAKKVSTKKSAEIVIPAVPTPAPISTSVTPIEKIAPTVKKTETAPVVETPAKVPAKKKSRSTLYGVIALVVVIALLLVTQISKKSSTTTSNNAATATTSSATTSTSPAKSTTTAPATTTKSAAAATTSTNTTTASGNSCTAGNVTNVAQAPARIVAQYTKTGATVFWSTPSDASGIANYNIEIGHNCSAWKLISTVPSNQLSINIIKSASTNPSDWTSVRVSTVLQNGTVVYGKVFGLPGIFN
jgi:hypothetical protein